MAKQSYLEKSHVISPCKNYLYRIERRWEIGPAANFILFNPSKLSPDRGDMTISRCEHFARSWGYDGIVLTHLFARRTPSPGALHCFPLEQWTNPDNDKHRTSAAKEAGIVIAAWGYGDTRGENRFAVSSINKAIEANGQRIKVLKYTLDGIPSHPLYVSGSIRPVPFE